MEMKPQYRWRCVYCDFPNRVGNSTQCRLCGWDRLKDDILEVDFICRVNPQIDRFWPKSDMYHNISIDQVYRLQQLVNYNRLKMLDYVKIRLSKRHNLGFWKQRRQHNNKKYLTLFYKYVALPTDIITLVVSYLRHNYY